jgi:hypothetical protein
MNSFTQIFILVHSPELPLTFHSIGCNNTACHHVMGKDA